MDAQKVEKLQKIILENLEIHTSLVGALRQLLNELGEVFTAEELFAALKVKVEASDRNCGNTYEEFWSHY